MANEFAAERAAAVDRAASTGFRGTTSTQAAGPLSWDVARLGETIAMVISSRTPEGQPNNCPLCHHHVVMEPSQPFGDAPCPHCGCLLRFEPLDEGFRGSVAEVASTEAQRAETRTMYVCPKCKTRIPFGTETKPPPRKCPGCGRRLGIPTTMKKLPPSLAQKASE